MKFLFFFAIFTTMLLVSTHQFWQMVRLFCPLYFAGICDYLSVHILIYLYIIVFLYLGDVVIAVVWRCTMRCFDVNNTEILHNICDMIIFRIYFIRNTIGLQPHKWHDFYWQILLCWRCEWMLEKSIRLSGFGIQFGAFHHSVPS